MKSRRWSTPGVLLLAAVVATGCASSGASPGAKPDAPEPAPAAPVPAEVSPEPAEQPADEATEEPTENQPAPSEEEEGSGAYGPKTVIVEGTEPTAEAPPRTLVEAARSARERRGDHAEPIAVITDETLSEFATGELTVATEPAATTPRPDDPGASLEAREEYWRTRVRDARIEWRDLVDEIAELEGSVAQLRNRFYAEDDGFYRDSQIKPAWDRALDRLAETRLAVIEAQENLRSVLDEGRREGAFPGWLREGLEYEPGHDDDGRGIPTHEPGEPRVVEEDGG